MAGGKKPRIKVVKFIPAWLDRTIDGHKVSMWLTPDHHKKDRACCTLCPKPNSFSITEGFKSVNQHNSTAKHKENLKASQQNPEFKQVDQTNPGMLEGLKKMHELHHQKNAKQECVLVSQIKYTACMMYHGIARSSIDCNAGMFSHLFPDSNIAKVYDIRRTKLTYLATHGLYPYFHAKLVQNLQKRPYSLNFDESTVNGTSQLDINVSYLTKELSVEKRCLTSVALQHGTTGQELALQVLHELETRSIDPLKMMSVSTDGCSAMIGVLQGAQKHLRDKIPTLPSWGGCADHDLANLLKSSVAKLCPDLPGIFSALHGCLNKHSMHKKRTFERMSEWIGIEIRKVPKFLSVRFRVIEACCEWLELQDKGVYKYFKEMKLSVLDDKYEASETEMIVLEKYLGNYLEVKLSTAFILDVCKPVMDLISFFESEKIRIQDRHRKLVLLLHNLLGKFMKNAGLDPNNNKVDEEKMLKVNVGEKKNQLSDDEIFLGPRVEKLLRELGLTRQSEVIALWIVQVREFYEEACFKMKKYFSSSLKSSTLKALSVLSPKSWSTLELDVLKKHWRLLGEKFSNVLQISQVPSLLTEVALFSAVGIQSLALEDNDAEEMSVDEFFSSVDKIVDEDGEASFPILSSLGSALATIYNSSSPAERDFSLMNLIVGDPTKSRTSQLLLLTKMFITAELRSLAKGCKKCLKVKENGEQSAHCHCELWNPPEDLLVTMRDGKPCQRYKKDLEEKRKEEESLKGLKELEAADYQAEREGDLRKEVEKFQKSMMEKDVKRKELEEKKKKEKEALKQAIKDKKKEKGKGTKRKKVSEAKKKRDEKRKRLQ